MRASHLLKTAAAVSVVLFTTTIFSVSAQANEEFYQVINVQTNDSLNIRAGASTQQPVIGTIPSNGRTILSTGRTQRVGNSSWVEVVWLGQIGWVNGSYLTNDAPPVLQQQAQRKQPAQINYQYQQSDPAPAQQFQAPVANAETHLHPANRCTRSVTHTHPNGANNHEHNYSCQRGQRAQQRQQPQQRQWQQPQQRQMQNNANAHIHPANRCTRSVTHSHPTNNSAHQHRYSCQRGQQAQQQQPQQRQWQQPQQRQVQNNANAHIHPANRCTRSVTHSHPTNNSAHQHRYSCQGNRQVQAQQQQRQQPVMMAQPQQMARPKYNPQPKYTQY